MNKAKLWFTLLLALIALVLIGWDLADSSHKAPTPVADSSEPTYQSQNTLTTMYDPLGRLDYRLTSLDAKYYMADQVSWFNQPGVTTYDDKKVATWTIRADRAKLTHDNMLYLYGHVKVDSLTPEASQLQHIVTDNAQVNLVTQDVTSDDEVTLYGTGFTSNGMKMRGNLRKKVAELIEKVNTNYEIPAKK